LLHGNVRRLTTNTSVSSVSLKELRYRRLCIVLSLETLTCGIIMWTLTGMFLEKKSFTGVETDKMTIDKFADDWKSLKFEPPLCNHALLLPRSDWRPTKWNNKSCCAL